MQELYKKLKKYTILDAIKIEKSDRQYLALEDLYTNLTSPQPSPQGEGVLDNYYLSLILANAIICYQLSGLGEDYWEEFSEYFSNFLPLIGGGDAGRAEGVISELGKFIKQSKNNKRFVETKIRRLEKLKIFLEQFIGREEEYYSDMLKLRDDLVETMKQKKDAKTIVFAVKMFSYGARNVFNRVNYFSESITIPVDSRLTNLFEKYNGDYSDINKFYFGLSRKLDIPELHLDAILWVNYNDLIK